MKMRIKCRCLKPLWIKEWSRLELTWKRQRVCICRWWTMSFSTFKVSGEKSAPSENSQVSFKRTFSLESSKQLLTSFSKHSSGYTQSNSTSFVKPSHGQMSFQQWEVPRLSYIRHLAWYVLSSLNTSFTLAQSGFYLYQCAVRAMRLASRTVQFRA